MLRLSICCEDLTDCDLHDWTLFLAELWRQDDLVATLMLSGGTIEIRYQEESVAPAVHGLELAGWQSCEKQA
jgi:hypothetical protein